MISRWAEEGGPQAVGAGPGCEELVRQRRERASAVALSGGREHPRGRAGRPELAHQTQVG